MTVPGPGGRQQRRKRSARSYAEARLQLRDMRQELDAGVVPIAGFFDKWLERQDAA